MVGGGRSAIPAWRVGLEWGLCVGLVRSVLSPRPPTLSRRHIAVLHSQAYRSFTLDLLRFRLTRNACAYCEHVDEQLAESGTLVDIPGDPDTDTGAAVARQEQAAKRNGSYEFIWTHTASKRQL
jgi:hypothetical protein